MIVKVYGIVKDQDGVPEESLMKDEICFHCAAIVRREDLPVIEWHGHNEGPDEISFYMHYECSIVFVANVMADIKEIQRLHYLEHIDRKYK